MERLFLEMCRERDREGRGTGPGFWLPLVLDTVAHAARERAASLFRSKPGSAPAGSPDSSTGTAVMTALASDLRSAVRSVARQPVYAVTIVFMMTVAIAGNAAVFRVFNGLFLRPLPFEHAERLVDLDVRAPRWNLDYVSVAYADFHAWREGNETFEAMGVFDQGGANFAGPDGAIRISVVEASHDLTEVLGLEPAAGRFFRSEEDIPDGPRVALVSHAFSESRYGPPRSALGRSAVVDGRPYEIVGVLPPEASFVSEAEVWVPLQEDPSSHTSFYLSGVGRLRPGVGLERAEEDLTRVHKGLVDRFSVNRGTFPVVSSLRDRYLGDYRLGSSVLLGAMGIVLLIACANIAGLMLARSVGRTREVGIRLAMGAPRGRIVRQLLAESLLLAAAGAALGAWVGLRGSELLVGRMAQEFPPWVTFGLDWRFVLFTVGVTGGAAVLFGLAPALQSAGVDPTRSLQTSSTRTTASPGRRRAMGALVAGQVALALVLLVVGGLGLRDFQTLQEVDPGVRTERVLSYSLELPETRYGDDDRVRDFLDRHLERVRTLPGVSGAAATTILPLSGQHSGWFFQVEGAPPRGDDEANPVVLVRAVTPGYLETMGVELVSGRGFTDFDGREEGTPAAVVNQRFVREFLAHRDDPVGARIRTGGDDRPWMTVVGVNRDGKHYGLDEEMRPGVYMPVRQLVDNRMNVVVRTAGDPEEVVAPVRRALWEQDAELALFNVATMDRRLRDTLWTRRASAWLVGAFSAVALILAVAGLYGLVSYTVSQRVQEIGIRIALGAEQRRVLGRVLVEGMTIVAAGVVLGLAVAVALAGVVGDTLVGVSATDPLVYGGVTALLLSVAALANLVPARRAARLDPMGVLRGE